MSIFFLSFFSYVADIWAAWNEVEEKGWGGGRVKWFPGSPRPFLSEWLVRQNGKQPLVATTCLCPGRHMNALIATMNVKIMHFLSMSDEKVNKSMPR